MAKLVIRPARLILDRAGREIGRVTGDAECDSP
jgi:hypothetical protein